MLLLHLIQKTNDQKIKTPKNLTNWLIQNKPFLNISAIGKAAGVPHLRNILSQNKSGTGHTTQLSEKQVKDVSEIVNQIQK